MIRDNARTLILVLAAAALAASAASLYVHYQMLADPLYSSFCDISESVSCEAVYASRYGTVFGVPVAAFGAIWAGLVLALGLTGLKGRRAEQTQVVLGYVFLLSLVAMAAVLYFGYISFAVLGVTCVLCLAFHASAIGIFLVSGAASSTPIGSLFGRLGGDLQAATRSTAGQTAAGVWLVASIALVVLFPRVAPVTAAETGAGELAAVAPLTETLTDAQTAQFDEWIAAQPREDIPVPAEAQGAAVVIQKFNDYICPSCRQTYMEYRGLVAKWEQSNPDDVKFVYRDFPLEAECGPGDAGHLSACEAAVAVRLAKEVGRDRELEAWLFDNQPSMTPDLVKQGLEQVAGVPAATYEARYQEVLDQVRQEKQLGIDINIESTPTFFVNGIRIVGGLRPAYLDHLIQYELDRARAATPAPEPTAD